MRAISKTVIILHISGFICVGCSGQSAKDQVEHGSAGKPSNLTGCLARGDDGGSFILRAENEPQPQGNERPERLSSAPHIYRLEAHHDYEDDLRSNVNFRVELTGSV